MGRKKLELDTRVIEELAGLACTTDDIARILNCSNDTLERHYREHLEIGRANTRASVRRKQMSIAMDDGNPKQGTMLIWLGKQLCGQREPRIDLADLTDEQLAAELRRRMDSGKLPP